MKIAFVNLGDCKSDNSIPSLAYYTSYLLQDKKGTLLIFLTAPQSIRWPKVILREVKEFNLNICVLSLYTQGLRLQYQFIMHIKKYIQSCIIFLLEATSCKRLLPVRTMEECSEIDYLIFGEGEITFAELIEVVQANEKAEHINGVCYRLNGKVVKNNPRELIEDLDSIPFPAYDLIFRKGYHYHNRKMEVGGENCCDDLFKRLPMELFVLLQRDVWKTV